MKDRDALKFFKGVSKILLGFCFSLLRKLRKLYKILYGELVSIDFDVWGIDSEYGEETNYFDVPITNL